MTFMIADGVRPSNNERGYVLRRIIRRAVLHAYLLGARDSCCRAMVDAVVAVDGRRVSRDRREPRDVVEKVVEREEQAFRATLQRGVDMLGEIVERGDVSGDDAFFLHDTLGFPIDLTREIAGERGRAVDLDGFERACGAARAGPRRGRRSRRGRGRAARAVPRARSTSTARPSSPAARSTRHEGQGARALIVDGERVGQADRGRDGRRRARPHAVLRGVGWPGRRHRHDHAPRRGAVARRARHAVRPARARSWCTSAWCATASSPRATRWRPRSTACAATASAATTPPRTSCTGRCARCSARTCSRPVRWSSPDRLRFDFSHHEAVTAEQLAQVERLANEQIISDAPVRHYETTKAEAERIGAIAFFGEKYGEIVRVLEAGPSTELCGGTHVHALGFIGPIKIVSESSIGSNLRRIEAMTGDGALDVHRSRRSVAAPGRRRCCAPRPRRSPTRSSGSPSRCARSQDELQRFKAKEPRRPRPSSRRRPSGGVVVARVDGLGTDELRQLAQETVRALGSGVVALAGTGPTA